MFSLLRTVSHLSGLHQQVYLTTEDDKISWSVTKSYMAGKVFTSMGYMAIFMGIYNSMNPIKGNEVAVKMQQHADIQKFYSLQREYEIMRTKLLPSKVM